MTVIVRPTEELPLLLSSWWRELAGRAVDERGRFCVALSGGTTPGGLYARLATLTDLPWRYTHLFLADERFVPPGDVYSNERLVREHLGAVILPANVHGVDTGLASSEEAAAAYAADLRVFFGEESPRFDLVILGLGVDGHTASLFPGGRGLGLHEPPAVASRAVADPRERVSLSLGVLNHARHIWLLVTGEGKADIVRRVVALGDPSLPAARLAGEDLRYILDPAAASLLTVSVR